jgi:hypothetical protein
MPGSQFLRSVKSLDWPGGSGAFFLTLFQDDETVVVNGQEREVAVSARGAFAAVTTMAGDDDPMPLTTERFERRLGEECGQLRLDMTTEFGQVRTEMATEFGKFRTEMATEFGKVRAEMAGGFGSLRAEMINRNADLLKWLLVSFATQTAAIAALLRLFR